MGRKNGETQTIPHRWIFSILPIGVPLPMCIQSKALLKSQFKNFQFFSRGPPIKWRDTNISSLLDIFFIPHCNG